MKVSVSFLKNKTTYEDTIAKINYTSCDYLHVDIMDGIFVSNKNFNPEDLLSLLACNTKPLDVHLMVSNPLPYIDVLEKLKPEYITIHLEIDNLDYCIEKIKKFTKVGLSIKPNTDILKLKPYLDKIDLVMVMGVDPGFGGQEMLPDTLKRIDELNELKGRFVTSIDGGVNDDNIKDIKKHNVDIVVSGSFITMSNNFEEQINKLK